MDTKNRQELIEKVKSLNKEEKYNEIVILLNDELLEGHDDFELYAELSQAKFKLNEDGTLYAKKSFQLKENAKAYNYYGNFINKYGKDDNEARIYYKKALELDPQFINSYYNLGNSYVRTGEYDIGIKYFKLALDIDDKHLKSLQGLGNAYLRKRMFNDAILIFNKALSIQPGNSAIYNSYGVLYLWKKELEKAEENFRKAIKSDSSNCRPYNNLAGILFRQKKYSEAKRNYKKSISLRTEKDSYYELGKSRIEEINKIQANEDYKKIQEIILKIKKILEYKDKCITHFTSLSVAKLLVFEKSKFRLSEGAFLNDTSEGKEFFAFLNYQSPFGRKENPVDEIFVQKPFIGSFVSEDKHNDLTMWRMYGKQDKDEAKGCAITIFVESLIEQIYKELGISELEKNELEVKLYKVAYWKDDKFIIPDEQRSSSKIKNLNKYCVDLQKALDEFNLKDEEIKIQIDVEELLFEIAFLFKGIEYQYEHEVRLIQKGIGFNKIVNKNFIIPRVYIELGEVLKSIKKITLGPKVERADEWASAFYYELRNEGVDAEIHISRQPFK
ncbi:tetratricopeptide repeat protein [Chryseobacterium camelliae]|uniref:tetratricopeptide repeat protein n=1 Tax=Chryseobacterium camelliae TaxID=1265445 RepID=UPI00285FE7A9|nr:tetratricopeptide repeat protein [Chryseobacterium camelliae]MDR6514925.1 tetratricopeptide (TPR) repeat protein [Chryseobacterium camelliae]